MYTVKYEFRGRSQSVPCDEVNTVWEVLGILISWFSIRGEVWKNGTKIDSMQLEQEHQEQELAKWEPPQMECTKSPRSKRRFYLTYEGRRKIWERTGRALHS